MGQVEAAPRFALHVAQHRAVVHDQLGQELERDIALELLIAGQPDHAHAAAAQGLDQRVAIKDFLPVGKVSRRSIQALFGGFATHPQQVSETRKSDKGENQRPVPAGRQTKSKIGGVLFGGP